MASWERILLATLFHFPPTRASCIIHCSISSSDWFWILLSQATQWTCARLTAISMFASPTWCHRIRSPQQRHRLRTEKHVKTLLDVVYFLHFSQDFFGVEKKKIISWLEDCHTFCWCFFCEKICFAITHYLVESLSPRISATCSNICRDRDRVL